MTLLDEFVKPWPKGSMSGDFIMDARALPASADVEGLIAWWALAGVDQPVCEDAVGWLRPAAAQAVANPAPLPAQGGFPASLAAFHDWLASAPDLPENAWPGPRVLPQGAQNPRLMIIVEAPESDSAGPEALFGPDAARMVSRMAGAVGLRPDQCYLASLSLVAPPGRIVPPPVLAQLAERMRRHIGLVAPAALLLLGDQASRALVSTEGAETSENLPFVNHSGGILAAASVAHPRVMLGQPSAKAEAWRALQGLAWGWGQ